MNGGSAVDILQEYAAHVFRAELWLALTFKVHIGLSQKNHRKWGGSSAVSSSRPIGTVAMESYESKERVFARATKCTKKTTGNWGSQKVTR
jgi:hypothetical protein